MRVRPRSRGFLHFRSRWKLSEAGRRERWREGIKGKKEKRKKEKTRNKCPHESDPHVLMMTGLSRNTTRKSKRKKKGKKAKAKQRAKAAESWELGAGGIAEGCVIGCELWELGGGKGK